MRPQPARLPFLSCVTGQCVRPGQSLPADYWVRHLREPVQFMQALSRLRQELPQALLLEVGPGQGLGMLARHNGAGPARDILASTSRSPEDGEDLPVMLASAAALWCRGIELEWAEVRAGGSGRRLALPTYPFERVRHWVDAPPAPAPGEARSPAPAPPEGAAPMPGGGLHRLPGIDAWIRARTWQTEARADEPAASAPEVAGSRAREERDVSEAGGPWLVLGPASEFVAALRRELPRLGHAVLWIEPGPRAQSVDAGHWQLPWRDAGAWQGLFDTLWRDRAWPQALVLDACLPPAQMDDAIALCCEVPSAFGRALQGLDGMPALDGLIVSRGAQRVLPSDNAMPWTHLVQGACGAIPPECPGLSLRWVDLDPGSPGSDDDARKLVAERRTPASAPGWPSAWRQGRRWQPVDAAAQAVQETGCLRRGAVCLITGGLGGIGMELAQWLARTVGARLALVGRTPWLPAAQWRAEVAAAPHAPRAAVLRRLLALQDAGIEIEVFAADAAEAGSMARVLHACEQRWGAVHAVFHAAGELEDQVLAARSPAATRRVIGGKAGGAVVLDRLLPQALDAFVVFSSTSLELGLPGQLDYIAANAVAECVALARGDGRAVRWGAWRDVGLLARAAAPDRRHGHPLLGLRSDDEAGGEGPVFTCRYDPARLWVLDEHRIAKHPVLPGAAVLEIARAAWTALGESPQALTIRQLSFERALDCGAGPREVEVRLRREGEGWHMELRSRPADPGAWVRHACALLQAAADPVPARRLAASPGADELPWQEGRAAQAGHPWLDFGPRWQCLLRQRRADACVEAELALDEAYADDLSTCLLHPALLDMGMTIGLPEADEPAQADHLWVPVAMAQAVLRPVRAQRLRARACSLPASRQDSPGDQVFDVELSTPQGQVVVAIEGLRMRRVPARAVVPSAAAAVRGAGWAGALRQAGISAADAPALFDRLLRSRDPWLLMSSVDLPHLRAFITRAIAGGPAQASASASAPADRLLPAATADGRAPGPAVPSGAREPTARSGTEAALASHWRELLGVERLGPQDDFFQLGGHSLIAVRLFARIRRQFGVDLPLATLFEASTLAALALRIEQQLPPPARPAPGAPASPAAPAVPVADLPRPDSPAGLSGAPNPAAKPQAQAPARLEPPWSPLVPIARGDPAVRPLFCVHGAGGNVLNFKLIADRLPEAQGLFGLQAQGVDGRLPPLDSIEAMAAQYLGALRQAQPQGPYRLIGYSAGGLIAFEMAQQLEAQGERAELLAMVDTLAPHAARAAIPWARKLWLARHWSAAFAWGWRERRARGREMVRRYAQAREWLARGETLTPELVDFHLFQNFLQAQARYQPRAWQGRLVLFKARDAETAYLHAGRCLGWERAVCGPIQVLPVSGSHAGIMREPGLTQLARGLARELSALQAGAAPAASP